MAKRLLLVNIKAILAGIIAAVGAIFVAFFKGESAGKNKVIVKAQQAANEYQEQGYEAANAGLIKEREAANKPVDTVKRDHFE